MGKPTVIVKSFAHAKVIAKALAKYNPEAASVYMARFSLRNSIEQAAYDAEVGVTA